MKLAPTMRPDQIILVNLSGRGDKDMHTVAATRMTGMGESAPVEPHRPLNRFDRDLQAPTGRARP